MALPGDRQWRKGNPNWKKGQPHPSKGRPEGGASKANSNTRRILQKLNRNPAEELIKIADLYIANGDLVRAQGIWEKLHEETSKHEAPQDIKRAEQNKQDLIAALEGNDDPGTKGTSNKAGMGTGQPAVQAKTSPETYLRQLEAESGADLRRELQPTHREVNDDGGNSSGNSNPAS